MPDQSIGTIRVSPDKRYFIDSHLLPVFWMGDTQWEILRLLPPEQALKILKDRQGKGFNVLLAMLLGVETERFLPGAPPAYRNLYGETPWLDGDPLQPNPVYYQHVEEILHLGELTEQTYIVGIYHQWHRQIISLEKARPWARWVAERFRRIPNLIWSMYPQATPEYIPVCQELASGLQEGDGGAHLICVHPDPAVASSSFIHNEPWLAFNMIQTCTAYELIPGAVQADYQLKPVKPVVMAEGGYEGIEFDRLQTAYEIRKQAYWTQLAGGHHVYGHNESWMHPLRWSEWLDSPGSRDLKRFREILTALPSWWTLTPASFLLSDGPDWDHNRVTAAYSEPGGWILIYFSEPGTAKLRAYAEPLRARNKANWIDPRNGNHSPANPMASKDRLEFTSPSDWEDAILLVE